MKQQIKMSISNNYNIILIVGLFLLSIQLFSQDILQPTDERTYKEYMDKVVEPLLQNDVSLLKNGILYDRVFPMADLVHFNHPDSLNKSNFKHFTRSLSELYEASVIPQTDVLSLENMAHVAYHFEKQGKIQIGIINVDFSIIDSLALKPENPKLEIVNQRLSRIADKNPYLHKKALVISPIAKEGIYGENIVFEFGKIFIQKTDNPIKDLVAVFENNQSFTIFQDGNLINESIIVNFNESGQKEIAFDVTFSDDSFFTTYAICQVQIVPPNNTGVVSFWSTDTFQGYFEDSDCGGDCRGKGEYKVYYKPGGNHKIMKPIIITDGFDPGDKRKIDGLVAGDYPYNVVAGFNGALQTPKPETIYNMMYEYGSTETTHPNIINELHALGFDVILLSFPKYIIGQITIPLPFPPYSITINKYRDGGSDYFERDAQVVKELIKIVNNKLTSNNSSEKIKLIAPSGGALVARIALVEMEQSGYNHNVDLFVSFDGPHLGANVPIGLQKVAEYFGLDYLNVLGFNPLENPWSKQSVLNHYQANSSYPAGVPGYRDVFQNKMDNLGFPQQCRNIAFNNGTTGTPHATAGANMFYMYFTYWNWSTQKREIWINFDSNSGSKDVFKWKKSHWRWWQNKWITDKVVKGYSSTYSTYGSLDTCPGSYLDIIHRTYKNSHATFPLWYYDGDTNYPMGDYFWAPIVFSWFTNIDIYMDLKEDAIFMPSKSTLAYTGSNTSWNEDLGCRDLVCSGETPFDSYYTPPENQAHVSVHSNSVDWLLQELNGIEMDPVYNCNSSSSALISGDGFICYNETKTYQINSTCMGAITWSTSSSLNIESQNNSEIQVKSISNNTGLAWVKASFNGTTVTKEIIGKPYCVLDINEEHSELETEIYVIEPNNSPIPLNMQGITDYVWTQTGGDGMLDAFNGYNDAVAFEHVIGNVKVYNSCGYKQLNFNVGENSTYNCENPFYYIEPLGQNKYKLVDYCDPENPLYVDASELYDKFGVKVQDLIPEQDEVDLDNTSNSGTIRIIMFIKDGQVITKKVIAD